MYGYLQTPARRDGAGHRTDITRTPATRWIGLPGFSVVTSSLQVAGNKLAIWIVQNLAGRDGDV